MFSLRCLALAFEVVSAVAIALQTDSEAIDQHSRSIQSHIPIYEEVTTSVSTLTFQTNNVTHSVPDDPILRLLNFDDGDSTSSIGDLGHSFNAAPSPFDVITYSEDSFESLRQYEWNGGSINRDLNSPSSGTALWPGSDESLGVTSNSLPTGEDVASVDGNSMIGSSPSFNGIASTTDEQPLVTNADGLSNLSGVAVDPQLPPSTTELDSVIWEDWIYLETHEDTNCTSINDTDSRPQDSPMIFGGVQKPETHLGWNSLWDDSLVAELDLNQTRSSRRTSTANAPPWWALLPIGAVAAALSLESDDLERQKKPSFRPSSMRVRLKCEWCRCNRRKCMPIVREWNDSVQLRCETCIAKGRPYSAPGATSITEARRLSQKAQGTSLAFIQLTSSRKRSCALDEGSSIAPAQGDRPSKVACASYTAALKGKVLPWSPENPSSREQSPIATTSTTQSHQIERSCVQVVAGTPPPLAHQSSPVDAHSEPDESGWIHPLVKEFLSRGPLSKPFRNEDGIFC